MQRWGHDGVGGGALGVTITREWGCSGSELVILAHGVGSSPSGGGARLGQGAGRDWPGAGPQVWQGRGFRGGAALTACALGRVALQQVEVERFRRLLHPRG